MIVSYPDLDENYLINVSRGYVIGAEPFSGYGKRVTAGAETNVLWPNGAWVNPPSAGVQMAIVSASASDSAAGTGIRSVEIHYIDANLAEQAETVTMNGTTPVNTVATNIRFIQCMHMASYGSGKAAAGNITATNGGNTYSHISAGGVRCESSMRMVPAGKRLMVNAFSAGSSSGAAAASTIINLVVSKFGTHDYTADSVFIPLSSAAAQDGNTTIAIQNPIKIEAGGIFGMTFSTDKVATIVGAWFGWLENA